MISTRDLSTLPDIVGLDGLNPEFTLAELRRTWQRLALLHDWDLAMASQPLVPVPPLD